MVYVIKNNIMIPQGHRNKKDSLWDIHIPYEDVHKRTIHKSNYKTPPSHAEIYISASTTTTTPTIPSRSIRQKTTPSPTFKNEFTGMEDIRDVNECNYWIEKQKKEEIRIQKVIKYKITHFVVMILRKDETKAYFVHFLHADIFSPVKYTLTNALNNN